MNVLSPTALAALRNRRVVISAGVGLVVLLIWLVAFFLPEGNKVTQLHAQAQRLQGQRAALEAQLAQLRATSRATPKLLVLKAKYSALIPPTPDIYNYLTLMSTTAVQSGINLVSITPSAAGSVVPGTSISTIPVTITTQGAYDNVLGFIKAIYAMPRLTVINSMQIAGGGPGSNRGTILTESFSLSIYTSGKPGGAS